MRYAIDIVIIPPKDINNIAFRLNKQAYEQGNAAVVLTENDFLPHISLLMGVVEQKNLSQLKERMHIIAQQYSEIPIHIYDIANSWMHVKTTSIVQQLHETVVHQIDPLLTHDASNDDFFREDNESITKDCYPWVNNFSTDHSFTNYKPHITIGNPSNFSDISFPVVSTATHIAVCRLGRYNTCREILWSSET